MLSMQAMTNRLRGLEPIRHLNILGALGSEISIPDAIAVLAKAWTFSRGEAFLSRAVPAPP
jgi:hypothetical protein